MQRNLHLFADLWNIAHLLPSIKLMIIATEKATPQNIQQTTERVS